MKLKRVFTNGRVSMLLLLAGQIGISGCSTVYHVRQSDVSGSKELTYQSANQHLSGNAWQINLAKGGHFHAYLVQIGADSTSFINDSLETKCQVATRDIRSITRTDRGTGALKGLMFGGALGGLVAWAAGPEKVSVEGQRLMGTGMRILVGTLGGALSGMVWGVIGGNRETYEFMNNPVGEEASQHPKSGAD